MRKVLVIIILFFLGGISLYASSKIDVIHCKNGDIIKGTIIENVPNDYVIVESGESRITIKYDQIEKFNIESDLSPDQKRSYYFNIHGGFYNPIEDIRDTYDPGFIPGLAFGYKINDKIFLELTGEAYWKNKSLGDYTVDQYEFRDGESHFIIVPIVLTSLYNFKMSNESRYFPYIGVGAGFYISQQYVSMDMYENGHHIGYKSARDNFNSAGFHGVLGAQIRQFYIDFKFATAPYKDDTFDLNFGGLTASIGARF